ncbi:MAG TPA: hypothetical protein VGP37_09330 [Candidatus Nanopelagicales bacterium]|nr:hypothetical protein [Candidatus Nanopelagicales bacterium]
MRSRLAAIVAMVFAMSVLAAVPVSASPKAEAVPDWSMEPQSKDANGDGFIDGDGGVPKARPLGLKPAKKYEGAGNRIAQPHERLIDGSQSWYLNPRGFQVRLDACRSEGREYRWRIYRGKRQVELTKWRPNKSASCTSNVRLPEGDYRLKLEVRFDGTNVDYQWVDATIKDYLFVVMGDSYASGEGNPRNVQAWLRDPDPDFRPYYDDDSCNRSVRSGPAQAALALEESSDKTSVTLIDVSCSGATINSGVLGPQRSAGQRESQIQQVTAMIGKRDIDVLTFSIGGNDIGFTSILSTCALSIDCPLASGNAPPLSRFPSVQDGVQELTGRLPAGYQRIADCLDGGTCTLAGGSTIDALSLAADAQVLPMTYPDITRSAVGQPCRYLTLSPADFAWARDTILVPQAANPYRFTTFFGSSRNLSTTKGTLNGQILATQRFGWAPVVGIWGSSGESTIGRGVCAGADSWVFGLTEVSGPFASASFHPNPAGQRAMGLQIARALGVG